MKGIIIKAKWDGFNLEKWAVKFENKNDIPFLLVSRCNLDDNHNLKHGVKEGDEVEFRLVESRMSPDGFEAFIVYPIEEQQEWDKIREDMTNGDGLFMDELYADMAIERLRELDYNPPTKKY